MFGVLVVVLGRNPVARLEFRLGQRQVPAIVSSRIVRVPWLLGGAHWMYPPAVTGQQVALPVSVDAYSCVSFGHSAWLTPRSWHVKTLRAAHEWQEPALVTCILSEG